MTDIKKSKIAKLVLTIAVFVVMAGTVFYAMTYLSDRRNEGKADQAAGGQEKMLITGNTAVTQDDMIYFIFTDRFNNGDKTNDIEAKYDDPYSYHGGDFQGIIDKLDYLRDLGFTAIWISPVVENDPDSYHGYLGTDFYKTNPNFGSMEKLKELVEKSHSKGIKVILDFVVNHTGRTHPWASDPKYYDWFHHEGTIVDWSNQTEVENGDQDGLPDFNQDNPKARKYLLDVTKWWIEQTGIDGFRLDTYRHISLDFWTEFNELTKSVKPGFYSVGEVFDGAVFQLADYQSNSGVDGMLDYPVYSAVKQVFGEPESSAAMLGDVITQSYDTYDNAHLMGSFIDNHDLPRFINALQFCDEKDRIDKLKQALTFMMTYTGIPILYYGTEIAMDGGADPDNRHDMDWNTQSPVTDFVKKLTEIRKDNIELTRGDIKVLRVEKDFICYDRIFENRQAVIAFNNTKNKVKYEVQLRDDTTGNKQYKDLVTDKKYNSVNGKILFEMEPYQSVVLAADN